MPAPSNTAVDSLLQQAQQATRQGDHTAAAGLVERALRITPRNATLWHRLAQIRLAQGQYEQAESTALRSNAIAPSDKVLQAENWSVIERARRSRGDAAGAREASQKANLLEEQ